MQQLTNEERARVFAMYWGNISFENGIGGHCILSLTDVNDIGLGRIIGKLLLTPLRKISDEDAIEVAKIVVHANIYLWEVLSMPNYIEVLGCDKDGDYYGGSVKIYFNGLISWEWYNREKQDGYETQSHFAFEELKIRGYAVPLWFGVGHWANGKTAIELEIANEKQVA